MSRKLISAAHSLQLVPVYNIIHFGIVHSKVVIRSIGKPDILMIVPGTLKPGDSKMKTSILKNIPSSLPTCRKIRRFTWKT